MRAYLSFTAFEMKLFFREFVAVFFTLIVPGALALIVALRQPDASAVLDVFQNYMPEIIAAVAAIVAMFVLTGNLVVDRELGLFKRILATPVGAGTIVASAATRGLLLVLIAFTELLAICFFLGGGIPDFNLVGFLLAIFLSCSALFILGFAIASLVSRPPTMFVVANLVAQALVLLTPFGLEFIGAPDYLLPIANLNPLTHALTLLDFGWDGGLVVSRLFVSAAILIGFCAVGLVIVRQRFSWSH